MMTNEGSIKCEFLPITGKCLNRKSGDASSNRIFQIDCSDRQQQQK